MKITTPIRNKLFCRMLSVFGAGALLAGFHDTANATQLVRELWDGSSGNHQIDGVVSNDVSTLGLDPNTTWTASPSGNTSLRLDNWNLDWEIGDTATLLPPTANGNGGLFAYYGSNGNMDTTLINPATGNPYGDYYSQCYATRNLTTNAYINFQTDGTYYFSVRFIGGGGYSWWSGDMAGGIGFASGNATNADFVGAGWTRLSPFLMADGVTDAGSSDYVTAGQLNQAGVGSHPDDSGGPYYPCAAGAANLLSSTPGSAGGGNAAIIVGKLVTTPSGASTLSVKLYGSNNNPDTDPNAVTWDATYSFTETNTMTQLLVWEYGSSGPCVQDAIRVGTTWAEAVGTEVVGAPTVAPGNPVFAGATVTLSTVYAGLNTGTYPLSYQWLSNNVPIDPVLNSSATNASLVFTAGTTNFTADYSLAVSNGYGMTTSVVTHLTVMPATPVYITSQPISIIRYANSPTAAFTVGANGTPPYTYQWIHAGTNFQSAVTTSAITEMLSLPPITPANAGNYQVVVTNQFGSVTSAVAVLTEIVPPAGSYAAAVTALSPWGYWRLDENGATNPIAYDYFGWNNGVYLDSSNMTFQVAGAPDIGWPSAHSATYIGNQWYASSYRLNLPQLPVYAPNMTFTMWVNNNSSGLQMLADNGYGHEYGLQNNNGALQFSWGGFDSAGNQTNIIWDSGLVVPANTWTFVALVVSPTNATVYTGTNLVSLVSVSSGPLLDGSGGPETNSDSTTLGDTAGLTPLAVGRNPIPWADGSIPPSQWASSPGNWSDIAIFYQQLTPAQIQNLYLTGVGLWINAAPDGAGNLILNWLPGATLQQASNVQGPYSDVGGSPAPGYSVPLTGGQGYYRVRE